MIPTYCEQLKAMYSYSYCELCNMCCPCMIATIPLATGNKLNCFINSRGMLTIIWHCALMLVFLCVFFYYFYMLINLLKKTASNRVGYFVIHCSTRASFHLIYDCTKYTSYKWSNITINFTLSYSRVQVSATLLVLHCYEFKTISVSVR